MQNTNKTYQLRGFGFKICLKNFSPWNLEKGTTHDDEVKKKAPASRLKTTF